jgi:hypothetical protein
MKLTCHSSHPEWKVSSAVACTQLARGETGCKVMPHQCVCLSAPGAAELVVGRGYPLERHAVVTPDGYELVMFRIPHGTQG